MLEYIQLIISIMLITVAANLIRFRVGHDLNRLIVIIGSVSMVLVEGAIFDYAHTSWLLLLVIGCSVISFHVIGGLLSAVGASFFIWFLTSHFDLALLISYVLVAGTLMGVNQYLRTLRQEKSRWLGILTSNSKQLNVFKEVSLAMQQTLEVERLLQTILTSMTAGYGLGFNRAMILLVNEEETKLNGILGTGPMTAQEGYEKWETITKNKYKLMELIDQKQTESSGDQLLNEQVKKLEISLQEPSFLSHVLDNGYPLLIHEIDRDDHTLIQFSRQFNMKEFAVIPLMNQGLKLGVVIIDNLVNRKPITMNDVDSVIPLANQAAIALQQTSLYEKIEDMALKDGLTGLFNQRAFQSSLEKYYPTNTERNLTLILLDIDYFKQFNDTNGHMMGNEVLVQLASVIQESIEGHHIAFRFGGEEFVVLLPNTDKNRAISIAEKIRRNVEQTLFPYGERQPEGKLTISLGVASSAQTSHARDLVDLADQALYRAKETGKNKVAV